MTSSWAGMTDPVCRHSRESGNPEKWNLITFSAFVQAGIFLFLTGHGMAAEARSPASAQVCKPVYLTLDTGNMRDAEAIASFLAEKNIQASFFIANEKTMRGDFSLDPSWADYWRRVAKAGHVMGSHTYRHGRISGTKSIYYRPQFGEQAGKKIVLNDQSFCDELNAVQQSIKQYTGQSLFGVWRAPGGHSTALANAAARQCGYSHVYWAEAGFLGDELNSSQFPNAVLVQRALRNIRADDILMAHLGIWSREEHFLPAFKMIIDGLLNQGFCFKTLREHPQYRSQRDIS